jgi:hypothetical protein
MAGVRSEHADRAAEQARREAEEAAAGEMEALRQIHAAELEKVERRAAEEVVDRLTRGLLGLEAGSLPAAPGAAAGVALPPGLAGNADQMAAHLLAAVGTPDDEATTNAGTPSPQVSELTDRLLSLLDPAELEA